MVVKQIPISADAQLNAIEELMTDHDVQIGIITGSSDILCHTERIAGFMDTLKPYEEQIHIVSVIETHDDEIESYEQTLPF